MRKVIFGFVFILAAAYTAETRAVMSAGDYGGAASEGARETVQSDVDETLNNARDVYDQMGEVTFEETIPKPENIQDAAGQCLDGILSADFGFGLNLPSIHDLFNQACSTINSEITDHLRSADLNLADEYAEIGAGLGGDTAPQNRVNYDSLSDEIVDDLWRQIEGDDSQW